MNVLAKLRAARLTLAAGIALRALVWGTAAALTVVAGAAMVDIATPLSLDARSRVLGVAIAAAAATIASLAWRDRSVLSARRVALWIEERFPSLEYALVTAVEASDERFVSGASNEGWVVVARRRTIRALGAPAAALILSMLVLLLLPGGAVARVRSPHAGDSLDRSPASRSGRRNRLAPLVAELAPPAYSGRPTVTIDEPTAVRSLVGSRVMLHGRGDGAGVVAIVGHDTLLATTGRGRWTMALGVGDHALAVRLRDGMNERIVAIEPVADSVPTVALVTPRRDSVVRSPVGRIALAADVADDIGLASAAFEYIVSSGEGETFTFRSGTVGAIRLAGRTGSLSASIRLDSLALKPGDILHLRAVARDGNTVTGPGVGMSETRAIRIARRDEYDSLAVDAAAPSDAEKDAISERMLIMLAEALQAKRPRLARDALLRESHAIGVDQKRLRRTVGDIVFTRLGGNPSAEESNDEQNPHRAKSIAELLRRADSATNQSIDAIDFQGGETPVVAVNKPLLEAYNAMWDASVSLEMGEPDHALPHMRRALAAIQKARGAERLYLRGASARVVIDIEKARLKGKDSGSSSVRRPLTVSDSAVNARADRFARIVELAARDPRAATDSLLLLRIDALADAPAFAAALGDAAQAMRAGKGDAATAALARARRALAGAPITRDSLGRWGIVP
jgi:hypothetical protein